MKIVFKKIRFYFRLIWEFWQKHQRAVIISFLVGILSVVSLPKLFKFLNQRKPEKVGLIGKFTLNELPLEIQQFLGQGLTEVSEDGQVKPLLAEKWEVNNEGKEYLFTLKENIFWQDNKPVKAADINYNFSDLTTAPVDERTIKFQLKEAFSPFPSILARPVFKKGLVGTGEYEIKKVEKNGQVVEKIVLNHTKSKAVPQKIFRFYPTEKAAKTAFKLGEVNLLKGITNLDELATWRGAEIQPEVKFNQFVAVFFNTQNPKLADKPTRQALAYVIKKRWEPKALNSINPQSWAYNPNVKPYALDLANAKKLLEKEEGQETLQEIELATTSPLLPVAEEIKKDWQDLGIETRVRVISSLDEGFEALLIAQEMPTDPDQYVFWHSTQETNISRYKSPKIDVLLEEGRKEFDQEKRKEIYQDFQRFLVEDTPAIFLFHPTVYTISRM